MLFHVQLAHRLQLWLHGKEPPFFDAQSKVSNDDWTPQYAYWTRPEKMDDGGKDVLG